MSSLESVSNATTNFIKDNLGIIGAGATGVVVGSVVGIAATGGFSKKTTKRTKHKHKATRKTYHYHKKSKKARRTPHTAGKRKDTSHRRIRQTKNGQPYVIMANGRARFISKKSARTSRRRKGGRY